MKMEEEKIDVKALEKVTISSQMSGMRDSAIATRLHLTKA